MDKDKLSIGFIGQGWIGKNYADNFVERGFNVIRFGLEPEYVGNKSKIPQCDIVFIAVPTPSTPEGFDDSFVRDALGNVGKGKLAVIKSTIPPGTTARLTKLFPDIFIIHAPEFLREAQARHDVDSPERLFIGIAKETPEYRAYAELVKSILPEAGYTRILPAHEAEFIKYTHNTLGYATVVFANILYDLARSYGIEWNTVKEAILNNPWFPSKYLDPVHQGGRGAGGDCFIKDFAALNEMFRRELPDDKNAIALLDAFVKKNNELLRASGKSLDLLDKVYGKDEATTKK